jgi:3D (Asp-Asp-Asp) domain-containing protein
MRSRRSASHTYGHCMRERRSCIIKRPSKPVSGWLVCVSLTALSCASPLLAAERRSDTVYTATAYSDSGKTASGEYTHRHVVAADPDVLPLGSRIRIRRAGRYSGEYVVADTGGKILGKRLDIYLPSEAKAKKFGVRKVRVKVLELGDNTRAKTKQCDAVVKQDVAKELAKNAEGSAATEDDIAAKNAREKKAAAEKANSGVVPDVK